MNEPIVRAEELLVKVCPICGRRFSAEHKTCADDGTVLVNQGGDPLIGTVVLGRYLILSAIGSGGWGRVYKAKHTSLGNLVAIKTLHAHLAYNAEKVRRFEQEAKAACDLRHENLAGVYDFGTMANGQPFLVMDYLDGASLQTVMRTEGTLRPIRALNIFKQIALGLSAAHAAGIVHRDIKPGNILLCGAAQRGELVKVLDFGLAKLMYDENTDNLTQTGETLGTPTYMSPEQCRGGKLDDRSDIYSLGCVMYEALTGVQPFAGATAFESMSRHVNESCPPFSEAAPAVKVPASIEEIVMKTLEIEPQNRYQTARDLWKDLATVEQGMASASHTPLALPAGGLRRPLRSFRRFFQRRKLAIAGGAAALLLCAIGGWQWYQQQLARDPDRLPIIDRYNYYMSNGMQALNQGNVTDAFAAVVKAETVSEQFTALENKRNALAWMAVLYHMKGEKNREQAIDRQLTAIAPPQTGGGSNSTLQQGEAQVLSGMLDNIGKSTPVNKKEVEALGSRINDLCWQNGSGVTANFALLQKNADVLKKYLGEESMVYTVALNEIGWVYYQKNEHQKALDIWLKEVQLRSTMVDHHAPDYTQVLSNIGAEYYRLKQFDRAEKVLRESVELQEGHNQDFDSRNTTLNNLAATYQAQEKMSQSYEMWKKLVELWNQAHNYDNGDWDDISFVLVGHLANKDAQTEQYLKQVLAGMITQYGHYHPGVGAFSNALAELYLVQHRYPEAQQYAEQGLQARQLSCSPAFFPTRRSLETLSRIYMAQHKYNLAIPLYQEYLALAERYYQNDSDRGLVLDPLSKLAYLHLKTGNKTAGLDEMHRYSALLSTVHPAPTGDDCSRALDPVFTALNGLGLSSADYTKLEACLKAETATCERDNSVTPVPNPKWHDALSRVYELEGRLPEALDQEKQAVDSIESHVFVYAYIPGRVYDRYAQLLRKSGKPEEAARAEQKARKCPLDLI